MLAEARWLAAEGFARCSSSARTRSYGKDLGDLTLLESLLPELGAVEGIDWFASRTCSPREIRPSLLEAMARTPEVAPYYDISFQHASEPLLRRMRRFGGREAFLDLLEGRFARPTRPRIRTNVIVGFPGETEADLAELTAFLEARVSTSSASSGTRTRTARRPRAWTATCRRR